MALIDRTAALAAINSLPEVLQVPTSKPDPAPIQTAGATGARKLAAGLQHEYSTMYPGDALHRAFILQHAGGFSALHYADSGKRYIDLPAEINHGSQPRWRRTSPDCFCYLYLNEIRQYDAGTGKITTLRKFSEYPNINSMGESDLSEDDDHIVLCSGPHVFVYEFSTDCVDGAFLAESSFNNLYVTATNRPLIGFDGTPGVRVFDADGTLRRVAGKQGHMDTGSDKAGRPVMVWCNSGDDTGQDRNAELAGCPNGIVKIDLASGKQTCLLRLDWSIAVHISLPDRADFALVSTYVEKSPNSPIPFANEILMVPLDGSPVQSLGKHGADSSTYFGKPRAAVSPDGSRYIYDSQGDVYLGVIPR